MIEKLGLKMKGLRKWSVAILAFSGTASLLVFGYDVEKLAWLATPLSAFFAANLVEYIPKIIEAVKKKTRK